MCVAGPEGPATRALPLDDAEGVLGPRLLAVNPQSSTLRRCGVLGRIQRSDVERGQGREEQHDSSDGRRALAVSSDRLVDHQ